MDKKIDFILILSNDLKLTAKLYRFIIKLKTNDEQGTARLNQTKREWMLDLKSN